MAKSQMAAWPSREANFPYTTVELMRVWDEVAYPAPAFIRDNLFGGPAGVETTPADTIAVDYWHEDQLLAPWVSKITMGRVVSRTKYQTHHFSPPKLAPVRVTHPSDLYDKFPGEPMGGPDSETRDARQLQRDMSELDKMIARTEEMMACSCITNGQVLCYSIEGAEMLPIERLDYETQPHVTVTPPWTDPASEPLNDIKKGMEAISATAGAQCDFVCLGSRAADLLENNQHTREAYNLLWLKQGELKPQEVEWQVHLIGNFRGINLYSYGAQYVHPFSGDMTPYINPNYVILAARLGGNGSMGYAGVWQESDEGKQHVLYEGDRVWRTYFDSEVKHVRCISRPVPLPPNSRTWLILEVAI